MRTLRISFVIVALAAVASCRASDVAGNLVGSAVGGNVGEVTRAAVSGAVDSVQQQWVKFSPEQEYYLGRAVAAEAVAKYDLDPSEANQDYVRRVGASVVALSTRLKGTYGGYHFAVLDTDEESGLSGPGGYVFITRGALMRCQNEDEVAGILCHELGHVSLMHGEAIIRKGQAWGQIGKTLIKIAAAAGDADSQSLSANVTELLGSAAEELVRTLAETGYGREFELEADREGTLLLYDVGYDAASIQDYLAAAPGRAAGTWSQHPPAELRIAALQPVVEVYGRPFDGGVGKAARTERYNRIMKGEGAAPALPPASPPATTADITTEMPGAPLPAPSARDDLPPAGPLPSALPIK